MRLNKTQIILLIVFLAFLGLMYFGMDTKPKDHKLVEKSRALNLESTNISNLLIEAKNALSEIDQDLIHALELQLNSAETDEAKAMAMENLSSKWYEIGNQAISGYFAEQIAELKGDDVSWSIAGTTYVLCVRNAKTEKVKSFCSTNGIAAFEKAISINPEEIDHKINLAVSLAEYPPKDNPMQGIMMLLEMNREQPDNIKVLYQLARFGLDTGQYEKAIGRLNRILELDPNNNRAFCLLSKIYEEINDQANATLFREKCLNKN